MLVVPKKAVPLQPQFRDECCTLGYGVMVTLQILVLSFLVRIRVSQLMILLDSFYEGYLVFFIPKITKNSSGKSEL